MLYYVNAQASRDGNGSKEMPFRHIDDAARVAVAGDEILVAPGIYREKVTPRNAGREDARIVYRSEVPLAAVITGAEVLTGWTRFKGDVWVNRVSNGVFGAYNPYTTRVCGDWYFAPNVRHTGSVYLNDLAMYETDTLDECLAGAADPFAWNAEESTWKWFTEQDGDETVLYANFHGLDPNAQKVEIAVRRNCFMPDENGIGYITVSGFDINKGATTWAPPAAYQDGLIGPHWSRGWIIEDCAVWGSRCCGISLGKYRDPENDMYFYTKHVKSPTQMERDAVCRGQYLRAGDHRAQGRFGAVDDARVLPARVAGRHLLPVDAGARIATSTTSATASSWAARRPRASSCTRRSTSPSAATTSTTASRVCGWTGRPRAHASART